MVVGFLFIVLIALFVGSIFYGRRLIRTEKTDAVFGNPSRALGGWHWIVAGVSTILLLWFYFSWDAARAFFPNAGNELCQVAKLKRAVNPVRSTFPLDNRLLLGTQLLMRNLAQIDRLEERLADLDFNDANRDEANAIVAELRAALLIQADPAVLDPSIAAQFDAMAARINKLAEDMAAPGYPGSVDAAAHEKATAQPGWGEGHIELPPLPITERGRKFEAAGEEMEAIAKDFGALRNKSPQVVKRLDALKERYKAFKIDATDNADAVAESQAFIKEVEKIFRRIDDGNIFPNEITRSVEASLIALENEQIRQQGGLRYIDIIAMPGGEILAGNRACSEQGSGRWLPKPSDTLATFIRMADPDVGYKGFPLLWFKMKPVSEMIAFVVPDWVANLVPGEYPRHDSSGEVKNNFKSKVYNFVTGNYQAFSLPIPTGHVWDSIIRVLAGLFFGVICGVPLGLFMGLSRFAKGYFDPLIELYRPVPPLAWAPLILTIFGIHDDGKIFLLFMVAFAIMVISARTGATGTQLSKIHAAHSLGASQRQILTQVILPNSLPEILTGIRISIGVCWGTLVAAEMLAGTTGIGFVENVARKQSDYEIIWMTIILLGLLGLAFDLIMRWIIHRSIPWRGKG
jgi:taurine transport system permease protein